MDYRLRVVLGHDQVEEVWTKRFDYPNPIDRGQGITFGDDPDARVGKVPIVVGLVVHRVDLGFADLLATVRATPETAAKLGKQLEKWGFENLGVIS